MKTIGIALLALVALVLPARAQLAPFWSAMQTPNGTLHYPVLLPDSSLGATEGGATYYYDIVDSTWKIVSFESLPKPYGAYPHRGTLKLAAGDSLYVAVKDTLYLSGDRGVTWRLAAVLDSTIEYVIETNSGTVFAETMKGTAHISSDGFRNTRSESLPERGGWPHADADTVWLATKHGNLLRSTNLGTSWTASFSQADSADRLVFYQRGSLIVLSGYRPIPIFPYPDSDISLRYSMDGGRTWAMMRLPDTVARRLELYGMSDSVLIFNRFPSAYLTSNFGATWVQLSQGGYTFVTKDGRIVRMLNEDSYITSTDNGRTWDTLRSVGILPEGLSVQGSLSTTLLSTKDSLYQSTDRQSWRSLGAWPGYLGTVRTQPHTIILNGTLLSPDSNSHFTVSDVGLGILNSQGFFLVGRGSAFGQTTDNGLNWLPSVTLPSAISGMYQLVGDTILIAGAWGLYRTTDVRIPFDTVTPSEGVTGAVAIDSLGKVYAAGADGKLYIGDSNAENWQAKPGPGGTKELIYELCATPGGHLYALSYDSLQSSYFVSEYTISTNAWRRVQSGLRRENVQSVKPTGIWYASDYVWLGSDNAGMFRSYAKVDGKAYVPQPPKPTAVYTYPSPATTTLTVHLPDYVGSVIYISDVSGQRVRKEIVPEGHVGDVSISIESLRAGMYELSVPVNSGGWVSRRFVKVR